MTISAVSEKYDIPAETLRYYERIGLIRMVSRTKSGQRDYNEDNCKTIEFIKCMRNSGVSIELLHQYIELFFKGDSTIDARKELLIQQREILLDKQKKLQETIDRLNYKIENYERFHNIKNEF